MPYAKDFVEISFKFGGATGGISIPKKALYTAALLSSLSPEALRTTRDTEGRITEIVNRLIEKERTE